MSDQVTDSIIMWIICAVVFTVAFYFGSGSVYYTIAAGTFALKFFR